MNTRANHHPVIYPLFKWLTRFILKRHFSTISFDVDFTDNGQAVLVVANHVSWWDGFWVECLNQQVIKRRLHFMMQEQQLRRHWYFQHAGGYPVLKGSRQAVESIAYTVELLQSPGNMTLMFPQGTIGSAYSDTFRFEGGIDRVVKRCDDKVQVLMVANLTDYFSNPKPYLFIYAKGYTAAQLKDANLEQEYNSFYSAVLSQQKSRRS